MSKDSDYVSREPWELKQVADKIGVKQSQVLEAIEKVGNSRAAVEAYLYDIKTSGDNFKLE